MDGLFGGNQCHLAETFDASELYFGEMPGWIKIRNRRANFNGELFNEAALQSFDAGYS